MLATALVGALSIALPTPLAHGSGADNTPWLLPTRPPRCTSAQASSGVVSGCLLAGRDGPDSNGWPTPPFPFDPASASDLGVRPLAGWSFSGYGYNGSAALVDWEAQFAANQVAVGSVRANQLRSLPDALPLFEGFLRDIQAGGYRVTDTGTYSFRCTSGSARSCGGLNRNSLSNHSWGLAMDMNSGANPEATYVGVGDASACATPMTTNIPMWVVQTAEKWGLYWGGYGWNSGCDGPEQVKSSATRDATHFEFRGSPAQARAIAVQNLGGSCVEVADDAGAVSSRCLLPGEVPAAGWRLAVDTRAPKGATAALVNVTMAGAVAAGFVTAESCGPANGPRTSSNGNVAPGQTVANLAVVSLDSTGRFCLYRSQPMHTIVDVQGFFAPAKAAGTNGTLFSPVAPQRVIDTRIERGPVAAGNALVVDGSMAPTNAVAMLANLTVTDPAAPGYLTADSCANLTAGPQSHSNANFGTHDTVANLAVVALSPGSSGPQFCTYASVDTQSVVDVAGYFAPPTPTAWGLSTSTPQRLVDTRACRNDPVSTVQQCAQPTDAASVVRVRAPAGAAAVLVNLTLTGAALAGFATVAACSTSQVPPTQSNGNVAPGGTTANLAVVAVDPEGTFCVRVSTPMHVVVDLEGTFAASSGLQFMPTAPTRRSDTRTLG